MRAGAGLVTLGIPQTLNAILEGQVTDASAITAFSINGESLWRRKTKQLCFGQKFLLQEGENTFLLEALDEAGNTAQRTIVVTREIQQVKRVGSRLRVSLLPFVKKGIASLLTEAVYDNLFNAFVNQRRFDLVERQQLETILQELKLSQTALVDPTTAAKTGKIIAAEGMLIGTVTETPQALEVFARFVDVETSVVLAAVDVYGEDLTLPSLKTLMEGMAWKLQRHFPLVEGFVIETDGMKLLTDGYLIGCFKHINRYDLNHTGFWITITIFWFDANGNTLASLLI